MKTTRSKRDSLVHAHLGLADALASNFARRYASLLERDDLIQVARLDWVRATSHLIVCQSLHTYKKAQLLSDMGLFGGGWWP